MPLASIQAFWFNGWGPAAARPVSCPAITVTAIGTHSRVAAGHLASVDMDEVLAAVSGGSRSTATQGVNSEVDC